MPLGFATRSHGTVAFGFFNVQTDLVLLDRYFVFAGDLCGWITQWAGLDGDFDQLREVCEIATRAEMGNLHAAMAGADLSGFIGAVYRRFPFPERQEDFRQQPDGAERRAAVEPLLQRFARVVLLPVAAQREKGTFNFGELVFDAAGFRALVAYLERGGLPRWADAGPPEYVHLMSAAAHRSSSWLFAADADAGRPGF